MKQFRRILVKLSGEALMASDGYWLDPQTLSGLAQDLGAATRAGFEIAVVIGGGNIIRGARMSAAGWIDRPTADSMGMLGTVMNSLALETALNAAGVPARTMSAVSMPIDLRDLCPPAGPPPPREGPGRGSRRRHRQPVLHHRHVGGPARRGTALRRGAEGNPGGRRLFGRPEDGSRTRSATTGSPTTRRSRGTSR